MMRLCPYDAFEIDTPLSAEAVIAALNDRIEPTGWFRYPEGHKTFEGSITRDGFKVSRIIHYRNSFAPVVRGIFRSSTRGLRVAITMRLHPVVTAFLVVWFGGISLAVVAVVAGLIGGQIQAHPMLLLPFAMLFFGWALVVGAFWFEAKKARAILLEMFKGQLKSEQGGGTLRR